MLRHVGLTVLVSATLVVPAAAAASGGHGREFRVTPDDRPGSYLRLDGTRDALHDACSQRRRQQADPSIAVNPRNPRVIAAGAMDACIAFRNPAPVPQPQHALGLYRSTDNGRTWDASLFPGYVVADTGPTSELGCTMHAHPSLAFDRQGRLFYAAHCPVFSGLGTLDFQVAVATFDRDGSRFVQAVRADPTPPPEQERVRSTTWVTLAVDATHSRHSGNVYVAYVDCAGSAPRGPCLNENESTIQSCARPTTAGRSPRRPCSRPRRALREHAGSRRRTRRHGARHLPHVADHRAAADLDRELDRRRRHVPARATGDPVYDVRLCPVRAHAGRGPAVR